MAPRSRYFRRTTAETLSTAVPAPQRRVAIRFALERVNWDLSLRRVNVVDARRRAFSCVITYFRAREYALSLLAHEEYDVAARDDLLRARSSDG